MVKIGDREYRYAQVTGFEGHYLVRDDGRVFSIKCGSNKMLSPILHGTGYVVVNLCKGEANRKSVRVHKLVAIGFIPNPLNLPSINHKDSDKTNNDYSNLEWVSPKQNTNHAIAAGRIDVKGFNNPAAKMTEEKVQAAWESLCRGVRICDIAVELGVGRGAVTAALNRCKGKDWRLLLGWRNKWNN